MSRLMGVPEAMPARLFQPVPVERPFLHRPGCGCLACADWRAEMRAMGGRPVPARDWRGEVLQ